MKQLVWRRGLLCLIFVVVAVSSLGCGNSLQANSHNLDAKHTKINKQVIEQKRTEAKSLDETFEEVAEFTGVILEGTAIVAWKVLETVAEYPCFLYCVICHR
jgi:hypothetical protein